VGVGLSAYSLPTGTAEVPGKRNVLAQLVNAEIIAVRAGNNKYCHYRAQVFAGAVTHGGAPRALPLRSQACIGRRRQLPGTQAPLTTNRKVRPDPIRGSKP
jgi:hypothetical protein